MPSGAGSPSKRRLAIRVGVTGKTGSGKTTVSALLCLGAAAQGRRALAVDTDPSPNLGLSLGLDQVTLDAARWLPRALVQGRGGGAVTTQQLVRGYGLASPSGVTVVHAMPSSDERGGCICPAHASSRSLLSSAFEEEADLAVIDIETGLDHLDRPSGTIAHTDVLLVVMEPSRKSAVTAARAVGQARAGGIERVALVGNKASAAAGDAAEFEQAAKEFGIPLAGVVPAQLEIVDADRRGGGLDLGAGGLRAAVDALLTALDVLR